MLPGLKRMIYNGIPKTIYSGQISLKKLSENSNSQTSVKNTYLPYFCCEGIIFFRLGFILIRKLQLK